MKEMTCKKKPVRNAWNEDKKLRNYFPVYFSRQFVGTDLAEELSQSVQNVDYPELRKHPKFDHSQIC